MNRWELEKKVAIKAIKDPAFKKKLMANPKETLKEFFKKEIDSSFLEKINIKVYEEKKAEWMIALPNLTIEGKQLSDAELEKLAAGCGCNSNPGTCVHTQ